MKKKILSVVLCVMMVFCTMQGVAFASSTTVEPAFTVQYYGNLQVLDEEKENAAATLNVIDTSDATGIGRLPKNGKSDYSDRLLKAINLASDGQVLTTTELRPIYDEKSFDCGTVTKVKEIDTVTSRTRNYKLSAVWVLKAGKNPNSTDAEDWDIYAPSAFNLTSQAAQGAVIRLVYDQTTGEVSDDVTLFDYDITDGKTYKYEAHVTHYDEVDRNSTEIPQFYLVTNEKGINSASNYAESEGKAKLTFGNANTSTSELNPTWWKDENGVRNLINQRNRPVESDSALAKLLLGSGDKSYMGCTFGLVKGLDGNGLPLYSDGIAAPDLFSDSTEGITGKTVFNDYELTFNRIGDTYTMKAVGNAEGAGSQTDLSQFKRPTGYSNCYGEWEIWSNSFWAVDDADTAGKVGHDVLFGDVKKYGKYCCTSLGYFPHGERIGTLPTPISDDGKAHNFYFGMKYKLNFTLPEDYAGPLEYTFFTDDEMWVFLDGQLVGDIGGVHSSIGEYVDLWDYIDKEDKGKEHTLSVFYTERGGSGATCYMRLTAPNVKVNTPQEETGSLLIEKEVVNAPETEANASFDFNVTLTDANGEPAEENYEFHIFDKNAVSRNAASSGSDIIENGKGVISLKDGQYAVIDSLPLGTKYTVSEAPYASYIKTVTGDESGIIEESDEIYTVQYKNSYVRVPVTPPTYTVTYTDGVDGEEVFKDEVTGGLSYGDKTPEFKNGDADGNPVRDGYEFTGWTPVVTDTVTGDVVYTATWKKIETETPEDPSVPEGPGTDPGAEVDDPNVPTGPAEDEPAAGTDTPKTGDENGMNLWLLLAAAAGAAFIGLNASERRKRKNNA